MAQSNSVQREPSMEEILASIRRIIEDSDTGRPASELQSPAEPTAAAVADVANVEPFRAGLRDVAQAEPVAESPAVSPAVEPAAATARAASIISELRPSLAAVPTPVAQEPVAEAKPAPEAVKAPAEPVTTAEAPAAFSPELISEPAVDFEDPLLGFEDLLDDELKLAAVEPEPAPAAPLMESLAAQAIPSIISDRTGRQVAAAFGELSEAFAATRQKSFDEMAEAMIRPMLSEWMDNNLPTLVERLVREEIERIARGPAR